MSTYNHVSDVRKNTETSIGPPENEIKIYSRAQTRNNSLFCIPKIPMIRANLGNNPNSSSRKREIKQMHSLNYSSMQKKSFITELTIPAKTVNNNYSKSAPLSKPKTKKSDPEEIPLFDEITCDDSLPNLPSLQPKTPTVRSKTKVIVSILDFDPSDPKPINEDLSLLAMQRLDIQQSELCYPSNEELVQYAADDGLLDVAIERLNRRVDSTIQTVIEEREALIRLREYQETQIQLDTEKARELYTNLSIAAAKGAQKIARDAAEDRLMQAIADLRDQRQKQIDLQKAIEKEEQRMRELEEKRRIENEKKKIRTMRFAAREKERNEFINNYFLTQERKEQHIADMRAENEEARQQKSLEDEMDVNRKLANAERIQTRKIKATKAKIAKNEQRAAEHAEQLQMERTIKQRELAEKNLKEEQEKERRTAEIKEAREREMERRRNETIKEMQKKEEAFNRNREARINYLEKKREINEKKAAEAKLERERKAAEKQMLKEKALEENEGRAEKNLIQVNEQKMKQIQISHAIEKLKAEDVKLAAERQEKKRLSTLRELEEISTKREKRAEKMEREKQKMRQIADRERMQTSFQFHDMSAVSAKDEFKGKSEAELRQLASEMGLDYDAVAAKLDRRMRPN